jgi:microcystin-dependent protein
MAIKTADELKQRFEAGDTPTAQDFIDLIESFLLANQANFPNPLPAVSGENLTNLPLPSAATINVAEYNDIAPVPSYVSVRRFSVPGNQVSYFPVDRRIRLQLTGQQLATTVTGASYDVGNDLTLVDIADDQPNNTVSLIAVGLINPIAAGGAVTMQTAGFTRGSNLTAAATLNIGASGYSFDVDGTTDITAISARPAGTILRLKFNDEVKLTHSANLSLMFALDFTAAAGDVLELESVGAVGLWREIRRSCLDAPGRIVMDGAETPLAGYLKLNGQEYSRTKYAALFALWGTRYGAGDGATTFNVMDMRAEFPRGWDDGRGVDAGRALGSAQGDAFKAHQHDTNDAGTTGNVNFGTDGTARPRNSTTTSGGTTSGQLTGIAGSGNTETRPRNVACLFSVKF